jgi:AraC-like DNA-binding protein
MAQKNEQLKIWGVPDIEGLECFAAREMTHHYGRHSHAGYALGVFENGVGISNVRGSDYHFPAGSMVMMNPDEVHTGSAGNSQPMTYRMFYISAETFQRFLPERTALPYFRELLVQNQLWALELDKLHRRLEISLDTLDRQTAFTEVLGGFAQFFGGSRNAAKVGNNESYAIKQIKDFLQENYTRNINLDELATLTGLHRAYLIRAFRRATGIPPYTYLLQVRVERAKELLRIGRPAAQAAVEVGFADQSHLHRHFKTITSLTPGEYAKGYYRTR